MTKYMTTIKFAPMEGITTYIFRNAYHKYYGGVDTYYTPFLSNLNFNWKELHDVTPENNTGLHVIPQILTNQAELFLTLAKKLEAFGYDEINLNLGCPSGTVCSKKKGAGFLSVPDMLDNFLDEIFTKCPLPISIKTRLGAKDVEGWEHLLDIYAKYPIKELIIHPRIQKQFYNEKPDIDAFLLALDKISVPVTFNGNIDTLAAYRDLKQKSPATESIMIGRWLLYDPELARIIKEHGNNESEDAQTDFHDYDLARFREFHSMLLNGYVKEMPGDRAMLHRMKEVMYYLCHYITHCKEGGAEKGLQTECDTSGRPRVIPGSYEEEIIKKIRKAESLPEYKAASQSILY